MFCYDFRINKNINGEKKMKLSFYEVYNGVWAAGSTLMGAAHIMINKNHPHRQMEFTDPNRKEINEHAIKTNDAVTAAVNINLNQKGVVLHDEPHQAILGLNACRTINARAEGHERIANAFGNVYQTYRGENKNEYNLAGYGLHHGVAAGLRTIDHSWLQVTEGHGFE